MHGSLGVFVLAVCLSFVTSCNRPAEPEARHPNVLFISIDDLRPELGCYGNEEIRTPRIDRFAEQSVVFTQTYCQAAVCAPSRASLMTGLRPDSTRVWHLGDRFREINPDIVTIPQHFNKHGYYTVSLGKIFHNYMPDSVSWDEPDLRPAKYGTPEMIARDAETFYHDPEITAAQAVTRQQRIRKNPRFANYGAGWNCGPAYEISVAHDTDFYDGAQTELAIDALKRLKNKDRPFFLALGYYRPHLPFAVPRRYWELYDRETISPAPNPLLTEGSPVFSMNSMYELRGYSGFGHIGHPAQYSLTEEESRVLKHGYYASVSYVDALVGKLLDALEELELDDNTIVIIWGDHGWKLGEHNSWGKMTNFDIDTHVPMIIRVPGMKAGGRRSHGLTELVDIFPTLCDLAGIEKPEYLQGSSIAPLLDEPDLDWKTAVFSQFHRRPKVTPDRGRYMGYSMKTARYHYIEWYEWDNENQVRGGRVATELYDHEIDPNETKNIAGGQGREELLRRLSAQLGEGWRAARI